MSPELTWVSENAKTVCAWQWEAGRVLEGKEEGTGKQGEVEKHGVALWHS